MAEPPSSRSAMVSRLPKFGVRPSSSSSSSSGSAQGPLTNGAPAQEPKPPPPSSKANGLLRTQSFSLKWKREGDSASTTLIGPAEPGCPGERAGDKSQNQGYTLGKEVKKAPGTPRTLRKSGSSSLSSISSPKAIPRQAGSKNSPKTSAKGGQSPLSGVPRPGQNGSSGSLGSRLGSGSLLMRPRAGSSSPRSASQDGLSKSSDSLKSLSLDSMVRSQSFTHFKQIPSPTSVPMARSFSFNRAVEMAKPLANTQLRPPRNSFLKPPQSLANGRPALGLGGLGGGGLQYGRAPFTSLPNATPTSITTAQTPTSTPSTSTPLKKPLLPNCFLAQPSSGALGLRLTRPAHSKTQRPLFPGRVRGEVRLGAGASSAGLSVVLSDSDQAERSSDSLSLTPDPSSDSDRTSSEGRDRGGPGTRSPPGTALSSGEFLEDMSLSSLSSLERGDDSVENLDDLDGGGGDLPDNGNHGDDTESRIRSFLNERLDWVGMGLTASKEEVCVRSPEVGGPLQGSSLELSLSNSSGGTYMWDEDGLEHPCDRYNSPDLNSMDILSHLERLDSGVLEEDDLMLDEELPSDKPEDGPLINDVDGMSHSERSERGGRSAYWRRRQHRWNGPDHFNNDNRTPVYQHCDGVGGPGLYRLEGPRALPAVVRAEGHTGTLDQHTLKHMAEDCTLVKNQLLRLKHLLQDGKEEPEDNTAALQLEELMQEARTLREELRSKDQTIALLTQQLQQQQQQQQQTPRCVCHQVAPLQNSRGDSRIYYDSSTQTPWRGQHSHGPTVLQPSSPRLSDPLPRERVASPATTAAHSDPPWRTSPTGGRRRHSADSNPTDGAFKAGDPAASTPSDPDELSLLLSTQLQLHDQGDSAAASPASGTPSGAEARESSPPASGSPGSGCPRILQPPRFHKRLCVPSLTLGGVGGLALRVAGGSSGLLSNHRIRLLPPPSRGLPCFHPGPQNGALFLGNVGLAQPPRSLLLGMRREEASAASPEPSRQEVELGQTKARGGLWVPAGLSRLPKPKTH